MDLRLRNNEARQPFPRKPAGRRVFCLRPALARPSQPAAPEDGRTPLSTRGWFMESPLSIFHMHGDIGPGSAGIRAGECSVF